MWRCRSVCVTSATAGWSIQETGATRFTIRFSAALATGITMDRAGLSISLVQIWGRLPQSI